jgi:hypothetical protein
VQQTVREFMRGGRGASVAGLWYVLQLQSWSALGRLRRRWRERQLVGLQMMSGVAETPLAKVIRGGALIVAIRKRDCVVPSRLSAIRPARLVSIVFSVWRSEPFRSFPGAGLRVVSDC